MNNETNVSDLQLTDASPDTRRSAIQAGCATTPEQKDRALNDEDWRVRNAAIRVGCATTPEQKERALTDEHPEVRNAAIQAGCATTLEETERALNDEDWRVRNAAIRAGFATTLEQKERALNDEDDEIRCAAIQAGFATTLKQKERALTDWDWNIRCAAIEAGFAITPKQKERALTDWDWNIRCAAIQAGFAITPKQKERALADEGPGVSDAAVQAGCATTPTQKERALADEAKQIVSNLYSPQINELRRTFLDGYNRAVKEATTTFAATPEFVAVRGQFERLADAGWDIRCKVVLSPASSDETNTDDWFWEDNPEVVFVTEASGQGGTTMAGYRLRRHVCNQWATYLPAEQGWENMVTTVFVSLEEAVDFCLTKTWDSAGRGRVTSDETNTETQTKDPVAAHQAWRSTAPTAG